MSLRELLSSTRLWRGWIALAVVSAFGLALGATAASAAPEDFVEACSSGIAVPDPEGNPGLVHDCAGLLGIRDALAGDATLNWSADRAITEWEGVAVVGQRVRRLDMDYRALDQPLTGILPPEIEQLSALELLSFTYNDLTGNIPFAIGNLLNLQYLLLSGNHFEGVLPESIVRMTNLKALHASQNYLTGKLPYFIGRMRSLEHLKLSGNYLSGEIPTSVSRISNLQTLVLDNNNLTGEIHPNLVALRKLQFLDLSSNRLSGKIPTALGSLEDLIGLVLFNNQLEGEIPPSLGKLTKLRRLVLSKNNLTGPIPPDLGALTSLANLYIGTNELSGSIPPELGQLSNIQNLSLGVNRLTGEIPADLGNLTRMVRLDLYDNHLSGQIPPAIGELTMEGKGNLREVYLRGNELTGCIPEAFRHESGEGYTPQRHDLDRLGLRDCGVSREPSAADPAPGVTGTGLAPTPHGALPAALNVFAIVATVVAVLGIVAGLRTRSRP